MDEHRPDRRVSAESGTEGALVSRSTPARFQQCGGPPALHVVPEQSGAGFGERQIPWRGTTPFRAASSTGRVHFASGPFLIAAPFVST